MREHQGDDPITTARFRDVATRVLDALLEAAPEHATDLGDHRFDDQLTDWSAEASDGRAAMLTEALGALDDVDDTGLIPDDRVDLEILRTRVTGNLWELTELRPHERDPLMHLPGEGLHPLIAKAAIPVADRLRALAGRLTQVPDRLATAREVLHDMPRVQVETAIIQATGTQALLTDELEPLLRQELALADRVAAARDDALAALAEYTHWLEAQLPVADGEPRLGEQAYAARLWYSLDTETGPDAVLTRAESDLQAIEEELAELASNLAGAPPRIGQVREMLDRSAALAPVTQATMLPLCRAALTQLTARVTELDLVTVAQVPVPSVVLPAARRGVGVAYCDPPGPLEYNGHLLRNLIVHEVMPGHLVQLAHAARYQGATRVRSAAWSGPFIEGWAAYAEELMAISGFGGTEADDVGLRLQQLKMQLRTTINAILDVRVHSRGMTEAEAMVLMTDRGHQDAGEATGKWRRALLTSAELSTSYVGYRELSDIARQVRSARPDGSIRQVHDAMLAHGSPPPRHLRTLLALE